MIGYDKVKTEVNDKGYLTSHRTTGAYINRMDTDDRAFSILWDKDLTPIRFDVDDSHKVMDGLEYRLYEGVRRANSYKTGTSTYKMNETIPYNERTVELVEIHNKLMDEINEIETQLKKEKF